MTGASASRNGNDKGDLVLLRHREPKVLAALRAAKHSADGRRISQRAAAAAIGISAPHLAQIETGAKTPSYRVAALIAGYYGVEVSALFELVTVRTGPGQGPGQEVA